MIAASTHETLITPVHREMQTFAEQREQAECPGRDIKHTRLIRVWFAIRVMLGFHLLLQEVQQEHKSFMAVLLHTPIHLRVFLRYVLQELCGTPRLVICCERVYRRHHFRQARTKLLAAPELLQRTLRVEQRRGGEHLHHCIEEAAMLWVCKALDIQGRWDACLRWSIWGFL
jgi:hypothetical protein